MSFNPDLNNERFFNYVYEIANQVQQDHKGISVQCLSTLESNNPFMFCINDEEIHYPIYQHIGMLADYQHSGIQSTAQETLYNIRKTLEGTIDLYKNTKHILNLMQQTYPELKEPTVLDFYVDENTKKWIHTPAFMFSVINNYHNEVSFILTADKLRAYTTTTLENRGEVDIMYSESTILIQDIHQPSDIKDLAINVLMKDATYQFRKHFGIEGVDY